MFAGILDVVLQNAGKDVYFLNKDVVFLDYNNTHSVINTHTLVFIVQQLLNYSI